MNSLFFLVVSACWVSWVTLFVSSADAQALQRVPPRIENLKLMNPDLSAGDRLDLRAVIHPGSSALQLDGSAGVWLGAVPANLFSFGTSVNRSLVPVGKDTYQIQDLAINPWYYRYQPTYTLIQFYVYDRGGNQASLHASTPRDEFYMDQNGVPTQIPLVHLNLNPHQQGDITIPKILSAVSIKDTYRPGEEISLKVMAVDNLSGIRIGHLGAGVIVAPDALGGGSGLYFAQTKVVGQDTFEISGVMIDPRCPEGRFVIKHLQVADKAGNFGFLMLSSLSDPFYRDDLGLPTQIPAIWFNVKSFRTRSE